MPETKPKEPEGWHYGIGSRSDSYLDIWLYTDKALYEDGEFGWEGHLYWDRGGEYHVEFIQYTKICRNGDYEYDYPSHQRSFETEREAEKYLIEKAGELR